VSDGEYLGLPVAIKRLKMNDGDSDQGFRVPSINSTHYHHSAFAQRLCREIISWKYLSHPNILPLLGASVSTDPRCFRILTEWMSGGNVMQYTRSNPDANRLRLVSPLAIFPPSLFSHPPTCYSSLKPRLVWLTSMISRSSTGISKGQVQRST